MPMAAAVHGGQGMVVPRLLSAILRRHSESHPCSEYLVSMLTWVVWLLRNDGDDAFKGLIERLIALPPSAEIKVCLVCERCARVDLFWNRERNMRLWAS